MCGGEGGRQREPQWPCLPVGFSWAEAERSFQSTDLGLENLCSRKGVTIGLGPGDWTQGCFACWDRLHTRRECLRWGRECPSHRDCGLDYSDEKFPAGAGEDPVLIKLRRSFIFPPMGVS